MAKVETRKIDDRIRAFSRRTGWKIGSNIYPGGWFMVSRPDYENKGREWRVAKFTSNKTVEIEERSAEFPTSTKSWIERHMAESGVSPKTKPNRVLTDRRIPTFPVNALDVDR